MGTGSYTGNVNSRLALGLTQSKAPWGPHSADRSVFLKPHTPVPALRQFSTWNSHSALRNSTELLKELTMSQLFKVE